MQLIVHCSCNFVDNYMYFNPHYNITCKPYDETGAKNVQSISIISCCAS